MLYSFYRFSHCQDRALERDRPQQRKKKSFWHAFSKSLVAVSISSPVTWHNVNWAIDLAMRCSAACSIPDMSAGAGCVTWKAVPVDDGQWAALIPVVGLPRW